MKAPLILLLVFSSNLVHPPSIYNLPRHVLFYHCGNAQDNFNDNYKHNLKCHVIVTDRIFKKLCWSKMTKITPKRKNFDDIEVEQEAIEKEKNKMKTHFEEIKSTSNNNQHS